MSSIGYRDWDVWVNETLLDDLGATDGVYLVKVEALLMAQQTVQFILPAFTPTRLLRAPPCASDRRGNRCPSRRAPQRCRPA